MKLLILFLSFSLTLIAQEVKTFPNNQLLWEITKSGSPNKSYLYATIHTNDKQVFNFCDSVYVALNHAQGIVLETNIYSTFAEWDVLQSRSNLNFDSEGKPYTSTNVASKTAYGDEDGMPQFLDMYFMEYCYNSNKTFFPLESVQSQLNLFTNSNDFFDSENVNFKEETISDYINGDVSGIYNKLKLAYIENPVFFRKLIRDRNIKMANGIDSLFDKTSLFIGIGAGHFASREGVIQLLRNKGYSLRPIMCSYSKYQIPDKKLVLSYRSYNYFDSTTNLHAIFPGKPAEIEKEGTVLNLIFREMGQGNSYLIEVINKMEDLTIQSIANDYILSPGDSKKITHVSDDGVFYIEGISDSYPEGYSWVRVIEGESCFAILKAYGGNKFMNSRRAQRFFSQVWFEF